MDVCVFLLKLNNKINHLCTEKLQWPQQKFNCWTLSKNKSTFNHRLIYQHTHLIHSKLQFIHTCVCVQQDINTSNVWLSDPLP
jgi:hypothetical protein